MEEEGEFLVTSYLDLPLVAEVVDGDATVPGDNVLALDLLLRGAIDEVDVDGALGGATANGAMGEGALAAVTRGELTGQARGGAGETGFLTKSVRNNCRGKRETKSSACFGARGPEGGGGGFMNDRKRAAGKRRKRSEWLEERKNKGEEEKGGRRRERTG